MLLSICIPTYNRDKFLLKNLNLLASQIRESHLENVVEINVSNNGSTDHTREFVLNFFKENNDIVNQYRENKTNEGPDANYIQTMHMANGTYSIMLGDDDYFIEGGLKIILSLISDHPDVDIFLSNRDEYTEEGDFRLRKYFVRDDIEDRIFDFSKHSDAGYYFYLSHDVGACLTFISSVIYKTNVLSKYGEYDSSLDGTYYSFWYYWWQDLRDGGKLYYRKEPYIKCTVPRQNGNFGKGLKRLLVEFNGFSKAAEIIFGDDKTRKKDFVDVLRLSMVRKGLLISLAQSSKEDIEDLKSCLKKCYWSNEEIHELISLVSPRFLTYCLFFAKSALFDKLLHIFKRV